MKSKKYLMDLDTNEIDYIFESNQKFHKSKYVMIRSDADHWLDQAKNEKLVSIVDDGCGVKMNGKYYEYHQFKELYIAMKHYIRMSDIEDFSNIVALKDCDVNHK